MIVGILLVSGCLDTTQPEEEQIIASNDPQERCIEICRDLLINPNPTIDMNSGTCLSEVADIDWNIEDWACDIAHEPRKDIDNHAVYQCQKFRKELVNNFVEISPNCELIRIGKVE